MKTNFYDEIRLNTLKSWLVMSLFLVLLVALSYVAGYILGDFYILPILIIIFGMIYMVIMYFAGSSMILAMSGAKETSKKQFPFLVNTVEGLAIAAGLPTPKVYVIEDTALNAFATGRDPQHSAIAVTTGLMAKLDRQELEGVIAHEMAHIRNFDIRVMMLAAVLVGIITLLSDIMLRMFLFGGTHNSSRKEGGSLQIIFIIIGLALAILAPFIAQLIKLAVSRKREYLADAEGARLTRYPEGLASALEKISKDPDPLVDTANKATAHLYISTPFRKTKGFLVGLFSTHPPIEERIRRLRSM